MNRTDEVQAIKDGHTQLLKDMEASAKVTVDSLERSKINFKDIDEERIAIAKLDNLMAGRV